MIGGHLVLAKFSRMFTPALIDRLRNRLTPGRNPSKDIQREREILRRWSRRNPEDRFSW
jgi:hypothetical protein